MVQEQQSLEGVSICVVGLGYVGLPLALAFGRTSIPTWGFDINKSLIEDLKNGLDRSGELSEEELKSSNLQYSADPEAISNANFIVVAVPTPVTAANFPDLDLVKKASRTVGKHMSKGTTVVYESTVYPGVTEDICLKILEEESGLKGGVDFKVGYSPERINPGDKEHTLQKIVKVVSGMDEESTRLVADVYRSVCDAGVFVAASIKVAEAAKVIENTQRDLNMALMNELSVIFHRMGINTRDVLEAAGTKWNFLMFTPGLVGGHCISVDPYYLVFKAHELGMHPQVITAGRQINDYMPEFVADETLRLLVAADRNIGKAKVLVMGLTFKENVRDMRNSKILGTIQKLKGFGIQIVGYDPMLTDHEIDEEFSIPAVHDIDDLDQYDAVIIAQNHRQFVEQKDDLGQRLQHNVLVDIKGMFHAERDQFKHYFSL